MAHADINWVAVMVAAFVAYVLGALWYSPALFAKQWMRLIGVPEGGTIEGAAFAKRWLALLASERLVPVVDRVFPLTEVGAAHAYMETNANFGKIVLRHDDA